MEYKLDDIMRRKKWPILPRNKIPYVAKRIINLYGKDYNIRTLTEIQVRLGYSRLYRYILQEPILYWMVPTKRLYHQILRELEAAE